MAVKFQFGLKWFLLVTTLIAILIGTVGKQAYEQIEQNARVQRRLRARAELKRIGVQIQSRRDESVVGIVFPRQVCKPEDFQRAAEIVETERLELWYTGFGDADVPTLLVHPRLTSLNVAGNPGITDVALRTIAQIEPLEELNLGETSITDEGLKDVARLCKLRCLYLPRTRVTSRGLVHLRTLQSLRTLSLMYTDIDDSGLEAIGELCDLEDICLNGTKVRGQRLATLAKLPKLRMLYLGGSSLQDGSGLAELKQITHLRITNAHISPGVLSHIRRMSSLRNLDLEGSEINEDQLVELASAMQLTSLNLGKTAASANALRQLDSYELRNTRIIAEARDP